MESVWIEQSILVRLLKIEYIRNTVKNCTLKVNEVLVMSYTALYRKFRPKTFEDVKGQEAIVTTLQNQIDADRIGHAYLFCGTRGTGKTTVAKIFAKAVNCLNPVDGSPCGECAMCKAIEEGKVMNVVEIDAASNNGVDNIREIREEVSYRPTEGKYKVYIIDEVHMLSAGAFNALLKTLEEPPEYVIFILATTELHKIPITILSRCQQYHFKRIGIDVISDRLTELMNIEGVDVEERAIRYIAKAADGSMRDALSLIDQCIAFYIGKKLTYDNVLEVLGTVDTEVFSRLLRSIIDMDTSKVLEIVEELTMTGRELSQITADFIWYLRNMLLAKTSDNIEDVLDVSTENLRQLQEESKMIDTDTLLRYIKTFSELSGNMKFASQKRVLLEVALIKACTPAMEKGDDSLGERLRAVERKLEETENELAELKEKGIAVKSTRHIYDNGTESVNEVKKPKAPSAIPEDVKEAVRIFKSVASDCSGFLRGSLADARPALSEAGHLQLVFTNPVAADTVSRSDNKEELIQKFEERLGKRIEIDIERVEQGRKFEDVFYDISKQINIEIIEED